MSFFSFDMGNYRMFGYPQQYPVYCEEDIINSIQEHNGFNPCFISLAQYTSKGLLVDRLVFDFDGEGSTEDAIKLILYFEELDLYPLYLVFSGHKGFHVYLKINPNYYSKEVLRSFQNKIINQLDLKSCDRHIIGDLKRMIRIPGTIHQETGKLCEFIDTGYDLNEQGWIDLNLFVKDQNIPFQQDVSFDNNNGDSDHFIIHPYPCIMHYINQSDVDHFIRVSYVSMRVAERWSDKQIYDECKTFGWSDFDSSYTKYQIEHIRRNNYIMPNCKTIKEKGYCVK
jgi:hypothetical protein